MPTKRTIVGNFSYWLDKLPGEETEFFVRGYFQAKRLTKYRKRGSITFGVYIQVTDPKSRLELKNYLYYRAKRKELRLNISESTTGTPRKPTLLMLGDENVRSLSLMFGLPWYKEVRRFRKRISESRNK